MYCARLVRKNIGFTHCLLTAKSFANGEGWTLHLLACQVSALQLNCMDILNCHCFLIQIPTVLVCGQPDTPSINKDDNQLGTILAGQKAFRKCSAVLHFTVNYYSLARSQVLLLVWRPVKTLFTGWDKPAASPCWASALTIAENSIIHYFLIYVSVNSSAHIMRNIWWVSNVKNWIETGVRQQCCFSSSFRSVCPFRSVVNEWSPMRRLLNRHASRCNSWLLSTLIIVISFPPLPHRRHI